jgi:hypothetical protein
MMFRKSLVPSVLFLSITALSAMASTAQAKDIEVPFKGSIQSACEFTKPEGGLLAGNDATLPTQLSSTNKAGQAGSVAIKCNTATVISASSYKQTGGQEFKVSKVSYTVSNGKETGDKVKVDKGETQIGVNLTIDSDTPIPAGDYSYNVIVTAAP